jgi:prepilin-type N-terminal cleavage/methylation domain-containing protein
MGPGRRRSLVNCADRKPHPKRRTQHGFTLLEVLAAALIFALAVTVLIGTSSAGVRMAGVSARRLEASLIADAELAQIEMLLNSQLAPPQEKEETDDVFAIRVLVEPALEAVGPGGGDESRNGGSLASVLATEAPGIDAFLLKYEISVEWLEGAQPMAVRRTTFAFDWEGARAALPDLFPAGSAVGSGTGTGGDSRRSSSDTPQLQILPSDG